MATEKQKQPVKAPTSGKEWRAFHSQSIADMVNGEMKYQITKEVNNGYGKQISHARASVEYAVERKEAPKVEWLD